MAGINASKVCLVGHPNVGKTTLVERFTKDKYTENTASTIGAAFNSKTFTHPKYGDERVRIEIWDTAGQERYAPILPMYLRGADVLVYCIDNPDYNAFAKYMERRNLLDYAEIFLVVTKIDGQGCEELDEGGEFVSPGYEEILKFCTNYDIPHYFTSARKDMGIKKFVDDLVTRCYDIAKDKNDRKSETDNNVDIQKKIKKSGFFACLGL